MPYSPETPPTGQDLSKEYVLMCHKSAAIQALAPLDQSNRRYYALIPKRDQQGTEPERIWIPTAGELAQLITEQILETTPRGMDEELPESTEERQTPFLNAKLLERLQKTAAKNPWASSIPQTMLAAWHAHLPLPLRWNLLLKNWETV